MNIQYKRRSVFELNYINANIFWILQALNGENEPFLFNYANYINIILPVIKIKSHPENSITATNFMF